MDPPNVDLKEDKIAKQIGDLPHALENGGEWARRLAGRRPAAFLDYDGTLTPIVDRPIEKARRELWIREKCP